jgi:hypothetical protein
MSTRTPAEAQLAALLHDTTSDLHTRDSFWDDIEVRARRHGRRRAALATAGGGFVLAAVIALAGVVLPQVGPPPPEIAPASGTDPQDPVERDRRAPASAVPEPITGYGDLGEVPLHLLDQYDLHERLARCLLDNGIEVALLPPGDGIAFLDADQSTRTAGQVNAACMAGLGLEPGRTGPETLPVEDRQLIHAYGVALHACLSDRGYLLPPPPAFDPLDPMEHWSPYATLHSPSGLTAPPGTVDVAAEWDAARRQCPQQPVGGYGAYAPGAPVTPAPPLPELGS